MDISVVIPLYNEKNRSPNLSPGLDRVMKQKELLYEIILVDDGSVDQSWEIIRQLSGANTHIGASGSAATTANRLRSFAVSGQPLECVITMDADLQDSPGEIPELYRMITRKDMTGVWLEKKTLRPGFEDPAQQTVQCNRPQSHRHPAARLQLRPQGIPQTGS
jgi:glycosyltransferase involved in cell wall biosynthesis